MPVYTPEELKKLAPSAEMWSKRGMLDEVVWKLPYTGVDAHYRLLVGFSKQSSKKPVDVSYLVLHENPKEIVQVAEDQTLAIVYYAGKRGDNYKGAKL